MKNCSHASVEPDLLVTVVLKLESADLKDTELTEEQASQLFLARLQHIAVSSNMLSRVLPVDMAVAIDKLVIPQPGLHTADTASDSRSV